LFLGKQFGDVGGQMNAALLQAQQLWAAHLGEKLRLSGSPR
jgi:hypothetical protein